MGLLWVIPGAGLIALGFAAFLAWRILHAEPGPPAMQSIGDVIYEGAVAFVRRQYTTIAALAVLTAIIIAVLVALFERYTDTPMSGWALGLRTALAFLVGAAASAASGIIGMYVAVRSNVCTATAARHDTGSALRTALQGGAVSGFAVVALSLLGVYGMFLLYGGLQQPQNAPFLIVGMGFGASFVALFAQLGGGIYTKAADVGADLVGKVEAGIPEDDPRNAAVVADLVGDNVGDCAGRGADLFESTVAENIGAMILGVVLYASTQRIAWIFVPLVLRAVGLIASIAGVLAATSIPGLRYRPGELPTRSLYRGFAVSVLLAAVGLQGVVQHMLGDEWFVAAGLIGLLTSVAFVVIAMYYTEAGFRPVRSIVRASLRGTGPNIITGLAVGFENAAPPVLAVSGALLGAFYCGAHEAGVLHVTAYQAGVYGTAVATMGMLMPAAFVLAMDAFGPIVDNAGGIAEMAGASKQTRRATDALDAAGNTTKALTKGYAIGSAALAAFLLFSAYLDRVELIRRELGRSAAEIAASHTVDLGKVGVFVGGMLGAMLVFSFSSLALAAVSRTAEKIIEEVRRQFREIPGLMQGETPPDYSRAVDITTRGALRAMIAPGVLAVGVPVVAGLLLGAEAEAALLMVGTIAGIVLASVMNNGGGAWDNAKKHIEAHGVKNSRGELEGKGSEAHKAAIVGDTVGDPFKDTAGPSLHVLIKLLATVTLVLAPLFV